MPRHDNSDKSDDLVTFQASPQNTSGPNGLVYHTSTFDESLRDEEDEDDYDSSESDEEEEDDDDEIADGEEGTPICFEGLNANSNSKQLAVLNKMFDGNGFANECG